MQAVLKKIFFSVYGLLLIYLITLFLIRMQNPLLVGLWIAVIVLLLLLFARFATPTLTRLSTRRPVLLAGGYLVLALLLCVFGILTIPAPSTDATAVYASIPDLLDNGHIDGAYRDYFCYYYNNFFLLALFSLVSRFASWIGLPYRGNDSLEIIVVFCALLVFLSVFLVCKTVKLMLGRQAEWTALSVCYLCLPLYLLVPLIYTDTTILFFSSALLFFLTKFYKTHRYRHIALCGVLCGLGFWMKATFSVLIVAVALSVLFFPLPSGKAKLLSLLLFGATTLCAIYLPAQFVLHQGYIDFSQYEALGLPSELWMCLGAHGIGTYCDECVAFARSFPTMILRQEALRLRLVEIYQSYTPGEYLAFLVNKHGLAWCDGTFETTIYLRWPIRASFLVPLFTGEGRMVRAYSDGFLLILYLANLAGVVLDFKRKKAGPLFFCSLCHFGLFLFLSFMESAARRTTVILPMLLFGLIRLIAILFHQNDESLEVSASGEPLSHP